MALLYGGDYNPEQWPEDVWAQDVALMRQAGVNLATVGVFSWARLEPRPGEWDFGWLDRVLDLLHEGGIRVDLATATASPPPWLARLHPESLPQDADGIRSWPGGRQAYCPSSPHYRSRALAVVEQLVARYAGHPALTMWHVNNEYGCHVAECYCDVSAEHFRRWLRARYGEDVEALNRAWGTDFWSQHYASYDEVLPPRRTPTYPNPTQQIDFRRFSSDALLELHRAERDVLKRATPDVPVTTNFMGFFKPVDYWSWAPHVDVVSDDHYTDPADPQTHVGAAMARDLMRGLGGGRPWVLMEQSSSAVNWRPVNKPKRPGQLRLQSLQAVARGADGICFFQWRASRSGAEKFHSGMLPHSGTQTRVFSEVSALGAELATLAPIEGSSVPASVAIVLDWSSWWGLEIDSRPSTELRLLELVRAYYEPLFHTGVTVDFVHPASALERYRLVIAPNLYLVDDAAAEHLAAYVRGGGTLVLTFFSGIVDEHDHIRLGGYPGAFTELIGGVAQEFAPLLAGESVHVTSEHLGDFTGTAWSEDLAATTASVQGRFYGGDLDGSPAVLRNAVGDGVAWYVATLPHPDALARLLSRVCDEAGVEPVASGLAPGVEAVRRGSYLFLLNHSDHDATVRVGDDNIVVPSWDAVVRSA